MLQTCPKLNRFNWPAKSNDWSREMAIAVSSEHHQQGNRRLNWSQQQQQSAPGKAKVYYFLACQSVLFTLNALAHYCSFGQWLIRVLLLPRLCRPECCSFIKSESANAVEYQLFSTALRWWPIDMISVNCICLFDCLTCLFIIFNFKF